MSRFWNPDILKATALGLVLAVTAVACAGNDVASPESTAEATATTQSEPADETDSPTTTVRATVTPGAGSLPFRVALENGYFSDNGLELEVTEGVDFTSYISALGRQFDVTMLTPGAVIAGAAADLPVRAFSGMEMTNTEFPTQPLITNDDSIQSVDDLRGKTVAVATLAGTSYGSLLYILEDAGVAASEVNIVAVPFPNQADQLQAGQIDAAVSALGFFEPLTKEEGYRVVLNVPAEAVQAAGGDLPSSYALWATSVDYASESPEILDSFAAALEEAITWIEDNPDEARQVYGEWLDLPDGFVDLVDLPPFSTELSGLESYVTVLSESGQVETAPSVDELVVPVE